MYGLFAVRNQNIANGGVRLHKYRHQIRGLAAHLLNMRGVILTDANDLGWSEMLISKGNVIHERSFFSPSGLSHISLCRATNQLPLNRLTRTK